MVSIVNFGDNTSQCRLAPTTDKEMRESGLDSWCACILSIEKGASSRSMISQLIHHKLEQRKYDCTVLYTVLLNAIGSPEVLTSQTSY
jgi:hypothetical protein